MGIVTSKYKKVLLTSKTDGHYKTYKINMIILIGFCCPLLRCPFIPLYGFHLFVAIANISFSIINESNIMIDEVFLQ